MKLWGYVVVTLGMMGLSFLAAAEKAEVTVAAYYFPSYHPNAVYSRQYGEGWTEWDLMKKATPRFPGHDQPKAPAWGYEDESDPKVMTKKIDAAADNGVDAFIFDWYWHNTGPFIEGGLEKGFLKAPNRDRLKFALMWANHDWIDIFPASLGKKPELLHPGAVTRETFDAATDHIIKTYFTQPNYWRIDGKAYFSVYELMTLVQGLGGVEATRAALDDFRRRADAAGVGPIHLNAVVWGIQVLPTEKTIKNPEEMLAALGFDSVTSYCWIHHVLPEGFPTVDYNTWKELSVAKWPEFVKRWAVPYYPNVSMGWDPSPRTNQRDEFKNAGYPFTPVFTGNTPEAFKDALLQARNFLEKQPADRRILTINAWNEWTEGSYLEPDTRHGMAYLDAIREIFGGKESK